MKKITIYTDGACSGNPGPGGYGAILEFAGKTRELSGAFRETTNSRMEILAAIAALRQLKEPCEVEIYSDSKYLVDSVEKGWIEKWKANNWIKADRQKAKNIDLWLELGELMKTHSVTFRWVKGHAGNKLNERCDQLCREAITADDLGVDSIYEQGSFAI